MCTDNLSDSSTENIRQILPSNVKPLNYNLTLEPDFENSKFDGDVYITFDVEESSSFISINAVEFEFKKISLSIDGNLGVDPISSSSNDDDQTTTFNFAEKFNAGSKAVLHIQYTGTLSDSLKGFYLSTHIQDGVETFVATTQFEPADARLAFPGYDEPAAKATYDITLIHIKQHTALSNMDIKETKELDNGKVATTFNTTPLMSSYLVAFIIGDLRYVESNLFRVPVRVYATPGLEKAGEFAAELAAKTLEFFEKEFDVEYPLPKIDMVGIHDFECGGMENWGLITYRVSDLLYDENVDSAESKSLIAETVQHELAHQWFGNLVTMEWWDGLWLNEGFATWMSWYAGNIFFPEWKVWESYVGDYLQDSLSLDGLRSSHPIEAQIYRCDEIDEIFDSISYSKGSSVLKMLANYLGEENFVRGVSKYLKKHKYSNTKTEHLWECLEEESGKDVAGVMDVWVKHVGYPVLTVEENGNQLEITQNRYLNTGDVTAKDDETIYPINLAIRTKDGIDESVLLKERSITVTIEDISFYKLNGDQAGVYRVKYPSERVSKLAKSSELLSVEDRVGLIADTRSLATSGYSKTSAFLELIHGWKNEYSSSVWQEIIVNYKLIRHAWASRSTVVNEALKKFAQDLVKDKAIEIGWNVKSDDQLLTQKLKGHLYSFAVSSEIPLFVEDALEKFRKYCAGDKSAIDPNLRSAVFKAAGKYGGKEAFEKLLNVYQTNPTEEGNTAVGSLGFSSDSELRRKALMFLLDGTIRTQNCAEVFGAYSSSPEATQQLWDWLKNNWDAIIKVYTANSGMLGTVVTAVTPGLTTKEQYDDVENFFQDKDIKTYQQRLAQSQESLLTRIKWVQRDEKDVELWLIKNGYLNDFDT